MNPQCPESCDSSLPSPSSSSHVHYKKRFVREYVMEPSKSDLRMAELLTHLNMLVRNTFPIGLDLSPPASEKMAPSPATPDSGYTDVQMNEPLDLSYRPKVESTPCKSEPPSFPSSPLSTTMSPISKDGDLSTESNFGPSKFVCIECGKSYKSASQFRAHVRRHESKQTGRYSCQVCHKNFVQRSSLKTHERIHTGEKPYDCKVCGDSFGDFSTFTKHRRTHTGEKPYHCPVCERSFSQSGNMHRHLKVVHKNEFDLLSQSFPQ